MGLASARSVLDAFLAASSPTEYRQILKDIGDHANVGIDQPFGAFNWRWMPFGKNLSNISSIGLATKPGRSLTERLTNATDAILEHRFTPTVDPPTSAPLATQQWFGRPVSGPNEGLFNWKWDGEGLDRRIHILLLSSGNETAPTVDVIDQGIGIAPNDFSETILSLQSGVTVHGLLIAIG